MYMRAVTIRIAFLGFASAAIMMAAGLHQAPVQAAPVAAVAHAAAPAVVVTPAVLLPVIHVRATAAPAPRVDWLAATVPALADPEPSAAAGVHASFRGGASVPSLRLDMPYYSFGKLITRVGKE
jgi:hypothetical protein